MSTISSPNKEMIVRIILEIEKYSDMIDRPVATGGRGGLSPPPPGQI